MKDAQASIQLVKYRSQNQQRSEAYLLIKRGVRTEMRASKLRCIKTQCGDASSPFINACTSTTTYHCKIRPVVDTSHATFLKNLGDLGHI